MRLEQLSKMVELIRELTTEELNDDERESIRLELADIKEV